MESSINRILGHPWAYLSHLWFSNVRFRERALEALSFSPPFYFKYVDDIAMAISSDSVEEILNIFNGFHPRLQFTAEIGGELLFIF